MSRLHQQAPPGQGGNQQASAGGQGLQQAVYMQNKLEKMYKSTYQMLLPRKDWIREAGEVLVWNRPMVSVFLYLIVHWAFIVFAQSNQSLLTRIGNLFFWSVVVDVLWRAATNQFSNDHGKKGRSTSDTSRQQQRRVQTVGRTERAVTFETAVIRASTPLKPKELPAFEVVCLWLAEVQMWLDNLFIALRYWSVNEPYLFCVCVCVPGIFLALLGKYIPTIAMFYILVIGMLTWPYIMYHDLLALLTVHIKTHYPQALDKMRLAWHKVKAFASKDKTDFVEVSLASGGGEGSEAFQDAFEHVQEPPRPPPTPPPPSNGDVDAQNMPHPPPSHETRLPNAPSAVSDPGMSILQDSVLGLQPNAFLSDSDLLGSLSLGPGDMPSMSDLDQSLTLPQFPSAGRDHELTTMPSITEEEDVVLPQRFNSRDLDPFTDSIEGYDFSDSRSHLQSRRRPHPQAAMQQIIEERVDITRPMETGSGHVTGHVTDPYSAGMYVPPPCYQSALDGSDGGMSEGRGFEDAMEQRSSTPGDHVTEKEGGGYWLRQRH